MAVIEKLDPKTCDTYLSREECQNILETTNNLLPIIGILHFTQKSTKRNAKKLESQKALFQSSQYPSTIAQMFPCQEMSAIQCLSHLLQALHTKSTKEAHLSFKTFHAFKHNLLLQLQCTNI